MKNKPVPKGLEKFDSLLDKLAKVPKEELNAKLAKQLESLNGITLAASLFQILEFVKITKQFSRQFKDCDSETEQIVKVIPKLRPYYRELYNHVKTVRSRQQLK